MKNQIKKNVPMVNTEKLDEVKVFYTENFGFNISVESEGYVGFKSADGSIEIAYMKPDGEFPPFSGGGLSFSFEVDDIDAVHERLVNQKGLKAVRPLQDNPWGDRSFVLMDPAGVAVYMYKLIPPSEEYKKYFKE